jgi:hypothetical protein
MDPKQSPETAGDPDQPIAWRGVPQDTEVRSGGQPMGTLDDLLGSNEEDIFHGIVIKLRDGSRRVFVPSDDVVLLTATHVDVSLSPGEIGALPEYVDQHGFGPGTTGFFRKHAVWVEEKDR